MFENGEIVAKGTWLYQEQKAGVLIQKMSIIYGTGDYEDSPEIREDQEIENYYVWFSPVNDIDTFCNGAGYGYTIDEAKEIAEELVNQKIQWS